MKLISTLALLLISPTLLTACAAANDNQPGLQDYSNTNQPTGGSEAATAAAKTYPY